MNPILPPVPFTAVLQTKNEYKAALKKLERLGLPRHNDLPKNWDSFAALSIIAHNLPEKRMRILDAGGEYYSVILPHLAQLGFEQLYCLNLSFIAPRRFGPVLYLPGDITETGFEPGFFDAVTCLSVLEHGVPAGRYFAEMGRIIRPGGLMIVSADYWGSPMDTAERTAYGVPVRVFDPGDIAAIIAAAEKNGFGLMAPVDLKVSEPVISWLGMHFTFIYLTFKKGALTPVMA